MQYGVCGGPEIAGPAAKAGYEYFEWTVGALLTPREDDAAFRVALANAKAAPILCPVVNVFIPADLKIVGPAVDRAALDRYVAVACARAAQAGVAVIVFGSGGARRIPDGFDRAAAHAQLVEFCRMAGGYAARHGVVIVAEPLNRKECNVLTTVGESAALVREVNHPQFRLLVDGYHWALDSDSAADLVAGGPLLAHAHVATTTTRMAPGSEPSDLGPFFAALRRAGYRGRMSIEGKIPNPDVDLPRALALMKSLE